ncbi:class I SAM-dependent DNA methyltransferase [Thetidibacter halocola]|uniref:Methyltransferase domain-containing protein n=1 Tax=Thetidibacter halocola TaxID=2827239 RepID=A0A8J7WFB8_9RHOB|nr:methyltransferase [Thetidibacter halocola]MBS0126610.1 methyltransferase domain-containing protein [Thetidibacter halocola]
MTATLFPSGDPAADRRAAFAETLAQMGDHAAAIEVMEGALALTPGWAAGWFVLGTYLEAAGRTADAAAAWDRAVHSDPADPLGAGVKRDLVRKVPVVESLPPAFVETLFDQYAPRFEHALVEKLSYRGPDLLLDALRAAGFRHAAHAMDLGCGTGLMGVALRPFCDRLDGMDLSRAMLAKAEAKRVYDQLDKRDIGTLELDGALHDLIVAADVFIYLGALERVIGWCAGSLAPGGWLAFTVEEGQDPITLRDSRRFAHSRDYVAGLLAEAGFVETAMVPCVLRQDRGQDVASLCVTARAPGLRAAQSDGEADTVAA